MQAVKIVDAKKKSIDVIILRKIILPYCSWSIKEHGDTY